MFKIEGVDLEFQQDALISIAKKALDNKTGARGLRGVIEESMLDVMYDIPSQNNVKEVIIDENVINEGTPPTVVYKTEEEIKAAEEEEKKKTPA